MSRAKVLRAINEVLIDASFTRVGNAWVREMSYGRAIVDTQESRLGGRFIGLTAYYPALSFWRDGVLRSGTSQFDSPISDRLTRGVIDTWTGDTAEELDELQSSLQDVGIPQLEQLCDPAHLLQIPSYVRGYKSILKAILASEPGERPEDVSARAAPPSY